MNDNTIILHDARQGQWLKFSDPVEVIRADKTQDVMGAIHQAETAVRKSGYYAAGLVGYEASPGFDSAFTVRPSDGFPLLWLGLYQRAEPWKLPRRHEEVASVDWQASVNEEQYRRAIEHVRDYIHCGDTYQVNFTFRLLADWHGDPWPLFLRMTHSQGGAYGAYVQLADWTICSATPELFFYRKEDRLVSRPMKGTRPRGLWVQSDQALAQELAESYKDRAENTMIVDVVRNDMSRIARPGSVQATRLFDVERYHTVWQMTSTVECQTDASLTEIFGALFPPASITGAPKIRTTEIIAELETMPRRIYTGSIGYLAPGGEAQFNIAIRTVLIDRRKGRAEYGVGGGIVWDSIDQAEYEECVTKSRVLTCQRAEFELLETLLWRPGEGYVLFNEHLNRQAASASYFGWKYDRSTIKSELERLAEEFGPEMCQRVRLLVNRDGKVQLKAVALDPKNVTPAAGLWQVRQAHDPVDSGDVFLYHKTTRREVYDKARQGCGECQDVLLFNEKGELTESTIANVAIRRNGRLVTPPLRCGLLGGTLRGAMLARGELIEEEIACDELKAGETVYLINSVRGMWPAEYHV